MHNNNSTERQKGKYTFAFIVGPDCCKKNLKKLLKRVSLEVIQKKSAWQHKKGHSSQKGYSIFFFKILFGP
jgi:hypothetical protein